VKVGEDQIDLGRTTLIHQVVAIGHRDRDFMPERLEQPDQQLPVGWLVFGNRDPERCIGKIGHGIYDLKNQVGQSTKKISNTELFSTLSILHKLARDFNPSHGLAARRVHETPIVVERWAQMPSVDSTSKGDMDQKKRRQRSLGLRWRTHKLARCRPRSTSIASVPGKNIEP
jgi:hypothetical protein